MQRKSVETLLYSAVGVIAMAVILVAVNILSGTVNTRVDLTHEKTYTLTPGTRAILRKLDSPVKIRFYATKPETATADTLYLRDYAKRVEDLLAEYQQIARNNLVVEKFDPQPDSDAEDSARLDGVEPQQLPDGEKLYLGLTVAVLDEKQTIPFLDPSRESLLEYDLSRAISRVVSPEKPVVGIMSPLPIFGSPANPMMEQMGQQAQGQEPWALVTELKNDFMVKPVDMDTAKIDDSIKVLLVIHPRGISDKAQFALDQFVLRGGKLIAFLDPLPLMDVREQNPMLGSMPNQGSSLDKLLKAWGLQFDTTRVVADMNYMMQLRGRDGQPTAAPAFLSLTADGINDKDVATASIESIWVPFGGAFTGTPVAGLKATPLLWSSKDSQLVEGLMANISGENIVKEFKPSGDNYTLAMRLSGKFKTAFPNGAPEEKPEAKKPDEKPAATPAKPADALKESKADNVVVLVGDADMIYDRFAIRETQTPFGNYASVMNGNLNFAQNMVEQLTGDENLIAVRGRATQNRPFTLVKKMQTQAEEAYQSKIKELEDGLADTRQRLNDLQQAKQGNQRFVLSPEQEAELEKFRKKEADINTQLKDERKRLRHDIDSLENRLKWQNILGMPAVVALSGICLAIFKWKRSR
jgi:ABC-type uncharacterized transport system involved in gliding motility auxiliary subunit